MTAANERLNKKYVAWQYFDRSIVNQLLVVIISVIKSSTVFHVSPVKQVIFQVMWEP